MSARSERVLYHTFSMRPRRAIGARKFEWVPAIVVVHSGSVWLRCTAESGGGAANDVLYCSDVAFFERMLRLGGTARVGFPPPPEQLQSSASASLPAPVRTPRRRAPPRRGVASFRKAPAPLPPLPSTTNGGAGGADVSAAVGTAGTAAARSDTLRRGAGAPPSAAPRAAISAAAIAALGDAFAQDDLPHSHVPFMVALHLYRDGRFVSDAQLRREVAQLTQHFPRDCRFVVRLVAALATDPVVLNAKVRLVDELLHATCPLWLEASFERLLALCALEDSALLRPRVFPALSAFLAPGEEDIALGQIARLVDALRSFVGVQLIAILVVDRVASAAELPELAPLLAALRAASKVVRLVMFKLERSPEALLAASSSSAAARRRRGASSRARRLDAAVDPMPLLKAIEAATEGELAVSDLLPLGVGRVVEPMLSVMGYGHFCVRPPPWSAFFTALVSTGELESTPLTRLLDVEQLYATLIPAATAPGTQAGRVLRLLPQLRGAVRRCLRPGADEHIPDLLALAVGGAASKKKARAIIKNMQIIMVHNAMDLTAMDYVHRCRCSMQALSGAVSGKSGQISIGCACAGVRV
jgi:hypothetical protein